MDRLLLESIVSPAPKTCRKARSLTTIASLAQPQREEHHASRDVFHRHALGANRRLFTGGPRRLIYLCFGHGGQWRRWRDNWCGRPARPGGPGLEKHRASFRKLW